MLKKLLKYDLKWCYKTLIVFYGLALFFAVITRILKQFNESFIFGILGEICSGVEIAMIINIIINNVMRMWVRFIKNLYKDESYLTHTLPVNKNTIFVSKILATTVTMLTSSIVIMSCLVICYLTKENWKVLQSSMEQAALVFDTSVQSFIVTMGITIFFQMLFAVFAGYLGIIIGYRANQFKLVKSIIIGFMAYTIPSGLMLGVIYIVGAFNSAVKELFYSVSDISAEAVKTVLYVGIVLYVVYNVLYYLAGKKLLEKGVNVD